MKGGASTKGKEPGNLSRLRTFLGGGSASETPANAKANQEKEGEPEYKATLDKENEKLDK